MTERDQSNDPPPPAEDEDALDAVKPKDDDRLRHLAPGRSGGTGT